MATYNNIFKITHNNLLPAQGSILISEPFLQDAYFQRSVVLLVEHNTQGSMGFVLNKKTDLIVNTFFPELEEYPEIPIYLGGPVSANRLFFIHSLGDLIVPDSVKIKDRLYFDGDFEALKRYIQNGHSIEGKVKFFLGYSGWTEGQLGNEISRNSWVVSHAAKENVLLADGESFWKNSLEQLGSNYEAWTKYPKDPYLN
ncbi:YqgE/AlgH family protein [Parabacteroides sp. W1-Q-101]|uniref:YqgE/AlgH family protein n=1 Tax=Parabacteroides TaxID=375288 RepID=UPI00202FF5BB|nr:MULTISPECIES: YqgE/AlgH family protein [Parabacteroides]MCM0721352.1 YqgE/AlgH family protein [Parabacteroides sp. W1-Q-101]